MFDIIIKKILPKILIKTFFSDDLFTFKVSCEQDLILPTFPGIKLYRDKLYEFDCIINALEELRDLATDQKDLEKVCGSLLDLLDIA
jgi:hypothetical protein